MVEDKKYNEFEPYEEVEESVKLLTELLNWVEGAPLRTSLSEKISDIKQKESISKERSFHLTDSESDVSAVYEPVLEPTSYEEVSEEMPEEMEPVLPEEESELLDSPIPDEVEHPDKIRAWAPEKQPSDVITDLDSQQAYVDSISTQASSFEDTSPGTKTLQDIEEEESFEDTSQETSSLDDMMIIEETEPEEPLSAGAVPDTSEDKLSEVEIESDETKAEIETESEEETAVEPIVEDSEIPEYVQDMAFAPAFEEKDFELSSPDISEEGENQLSYVPDEDAIPEPPEPLPNISLMKDEGEAEEETESESLFLDIPPIEEMPSEQEEEYVIEESDTNLESFKEAGMLVETSDQEISDITDEPFLHEEDEESYDEIPASEAIHEEESIIEDMDGKVYPMDDRYRDTNEMQSISVAEDEEMIKSPVEEELEEPPLPDFKEQGDEEESPEDKHLDEDLSETEEQPASEIVLDKGEPEVEPEYTDFPPPIESLQPELPEPEFDKEEEEEIETLQEVDKLEETGDELAGPVELEMPPIPPTELPKPLTVEDKAPPPPLDEEMTDDQKEALLEYEEMLKKAKNDAEEFISDKTGASKSFEMSPGVPLETPSMTETPETSIQQTSEPIPLTMPLSDSEEKLPDSRPSKEDGESTVQPIAKEKISDLQYKSVPLDNKDKEQPGESVNSFKGFLSKIKKKKEGGDKQ
ncbi:MAG: hypothetical protein JW737_02540 [Acidobacteria bacterium]|nr:hypothetical protein [Acidobacteriota bacterium]